MWIKKLLENYTKKSKNYLDRLALNRVVLNNVIKYNPSIAEGIYVNGDVMLTSGATLINSRVTGKVTLNGINITMMHNIVDKEIVYFNS